MNLSVFEEMNSFYQNYCNCPRCAANIVTDAQLACAQIAEDENVNQIWNKITTNPVYLVVILVIVYLLGVITVMTVMCCRSKCHNRQVAKIKKKIYREKIIEDEIDRRSLLMTPAIPEPFYEPIAHISIPKPPLQRSMSMRSHTGIPCPSPRRDTPRRMTPCTTQATPTRNRTPRKARPTIFEHLNE